jgi:hypothetical protein
VTRDCDFYHPFFKIPVLGFELRAYSFAKQGLYHLNYDPNPEIVTSILLAEIVAFFVCFGEVSCHVGKFSWQRAEGYLQPTTSKKLNPKDN